MTWLISIERVRSQNGHAVRLLDIVSHLAPAPIPKVIFETWVSADRNAAALQLNEAIAALRRYSLINARTTDVVVHRLLQDVVRAHKKKDIFASRARRILRRGVPFSSILFGTSPLTARYVCSCARRCFIHRREHPHTCWFVVYFDQRGDLEAVKRTLQLAASRLHTRIPDFLQLSVLTKLTQVQWGLGHIAEANSTLLSAFTVDQNFDPHGPGEFECRVEFLSALTDMALRTPDAEPEKLLKLIQRAVKIATDVKLEPGMAARAYGDMSRVLSRLGRHDEAIEAATVGVKLDREMLGSAHPALALRLSALASAYEVAQRADEAQAARREALEVAENAYGDDSMTVRYCILLADALQLDGDHPGAMQLYDRAIARSRLLTAEWVLNLLQSRATTLSSLGRDGEAIADLDQAIALAETTGARVAFIDELRHQRHRMAG